MKLKAYLKKEGISINDFAEQLELCRSTISEAINKGVVWQKTALKIINATNGEVTKEDFPLIKFTTLHIAK